MHVKCRRVISFINYVILKAEQEWFTVAIVNRQGFPLNWRRELSKLKDDGE